MRYQTLQKAMPLQVDSTSVKDKADGESASGEGYRTAVRAPVSTPAATSSKSSFETPGTTQEPPATFLPAERFSPPVTQNNYYITAHQSNVAVNNGTVKQSQHQVELERAAGKFRAELGGDLETFVREAFPNTQHTPRPAPPSFHPAPQNGAYPGLSRHRELVLQSVRDTVDMVLAGLPDLGLDRPAQERVRQAAAEIDAELQRPTSDPLRVGSSLSSMLDGLTRARQTGGAAMGQRATVAESIRNVRGQVRALPTVGTVQP
ncbi:hypothetical protein AB0E78_22715 [Streptomyces sp. NPDC032198]|uniref:hypothetical protein n=1 Tax=Streptomyces sp. NPDC032198 TaxID=3155127 RepID=UPI0033C29441